MSKLRSFFSATPKDLFMQKYSISDIADRMKKTDQDPARLPISFAKRVTRILESDSAHSRDESDDHR